MTKSFYDKIGARIGWDFSKIYTKLKTKRKWDFINLVSKHISPNQVLLDIGTGGGEILLNLAAKAKFSYGIDNSPAMIRTAKINLTKTKFKNKVKFLVEDSHALHFKEEYFDLIICRHAPFSTTEVFRVLKRGGIFITQQVAENDKISFKRIFSRGQNFGIKPGTLMRDYLFQLKNSGFNITKTENYNVTEYYPHKDLLFLLRNTPIIPNFNLKKDNIFLDRLIRSFSTTKGIITNESRFLILARKS